MQQKLMSSGNQAQQIMIDKLNEEREVIEKEHQEKIKQMADKLVDAQKLVQEEIKKQQEI